ncbi:MAG: D-alanyl-D-alanine carboxypeptidase [Clostridia bacterium]|nr:D-alanyl-D-alanine carboxypeptidase [Clostridia bacterium]MBR0445074.1 D-alanyl-D-alanine carboxypeptidase [Clostridia bacterium]
MKKKCLSCLFAAMLLFAAVIPGIALADFNYDVIGTPHIIVIDASDLSAASPVYERAADEQIYPASTTKMLTCLLALEHSSPDAEVTVGEEIRGFFETKKGYTTGPSGSSLMGLVVGETVTMRDLMYGLMLSSGNDAADAIAVAIGGTIQDFVSMMNEKAAEIGMTGSHFTNPNGVHNDNHYSTARDMAKLAAYAMNNQTFAEIVRTPAYTVPSNSTRQQDLNLINSNFLLTSLGSSNYSSYPYEYCIGIKTGMTPKSGYCLVAAAEKDGARAIVCLYGDPSDGSSMDRFANAKRIFEDLFDTAYVTVSADQLTLENSFSCAVPHARPEDLDEDGLLHLTVDQASFTIKTLPQEANAILNGTSPVTAEVQWIDSLSAPIHQGQQIGIVNYKLGNKTLYTTVLTSPRDILEVAVISQGESSEALADGSQVASNSLLTAPEISPKPTSKPSSPVSPFVIVLIILIVILIIALAVVLIVSSSQKKKRTQARKRRTGYSSPTARQGDTYRPASRNRSARSSSERSSRDYYSRTGRPSERNSSTRSRNYSSERDRQRR